MTEAPVHRLYHHFSELPASVRVMYTCVLLVFGMAYLFALVLIFHTYSGKDGNPKSLSYDDIVIGYSGSGKGSRIEGALRGSMSVMLPLEEKNALLAWVGKARTAPSSRPASGRSWTSAAWPATTAATRTCRT